LANPAQPQLTAEVPFAGFDAHAVAVQGSQVAVLCDPPAYGTPQRLFVLDASDPLAPVVRGSADQGPVIPGGGYAAALCVSGDFAYVGSYWQFFLGYLEAKVLVVDLGNPSQPVTVGETSFGSYSTWPFRLVHQDGLVFFGYDVQGDKGVAVANVRIPTSPFMPAYLPLSQYPYESWTPADVRVSKNYLYVGSHTVLQIYAFPSALLGQPVISGTDVIISWNTNGLGMRLERTTQLNPANWQDVPGATTTNSLSVPRSERAFFRLAYP
jgi:hypothetical protein